MIGKFTEEILIYIGHYRERGGVPREVLFDKFSYIKAEVVEEILIKLHEKGDIYEPRPNYYLVV